MDAQTLALDAETRQLGFPPRPMVRDPKHNRYYRCLVKSLDYSREQVQLQWEYSFNQGLFWLPLSSDRIWLGSYKHKDWHHQGEGAWKPTASAQQALAAQEPATREAQRLAVARITGSTQPPLNFTMVPPQAATYTTQQQPRKAKRELQPSQGRPPKQPRYSSGSGMLQHKGSYGNRSPACSSPNVGAGSHSSQLLALRRDASDSGAAAAPASSMPRPQLIQSNKCMQQACSAELQSISSNTAAPAWQGPVDPFGTNVPASTTVADAEPDTASTGAGQQVIQATAQSQRAHGDMCAIPQEQQLDKLGAALLPAETSSKQRACTRLKQLKRSALSRLAAPAAHGVAGFVGIPAPEECNVEHQHKSAVMGAPADGMSGDLEAVLSGSTTAVSRHMRSVRLYKRSLGKAMALAQMSVSPDQWQTQQDQAAMVAAPVELPEWLLWLRGAVARDPETALVGSGADVVGHIKAATAFQQERSRRCQPEWELVSDDACNDEAVSHLQQHSSRDVLVMLQQLARNVEAAAAAAAAAQGAVAREAPCKLSAGEAGAAHLAASCQPSDTAAESSSSVSSSRSNQYTAANLAASDLGIRAMGSNKPTTHPVPAMATQPQVCSSSQHSRFGSQPIFSPAAVTAVKLLRQLQLQPYAAHELAADLQGVMLPRRATFLGIHRIQQRAPDSRSYVDAFVAYVRGGRVHSVPPRRPQGEGLRIGVFDSLQDAMCAFDLTSLVLNGPGKAVLHFPASCYPLREVINWRAVLAEEWDWLQGCPHL